MQRNPKDKSSHVFKGKKIVHGEEVNTFSISMEKWVMRFISAITSLKRATHQRVYPMLTSTHLLTKKKDPKRFGVPKNKITLVANLFDSRKETPIMVPGQWLLTTHDRWKVYVPIPKPGVITFGGNHKGRIIRVGKACIPPYPPIDNVLLVKGLKHNLLSISQLCDNGYNVTFN